MPLVKVAALSGLLCVAAIAPLAADAASGSGNYVYERRYGLEMANGFSTYSETRRARVIRLKKGSESLTIQNTMDGAAVVDTMQGSRGVPLRDVSTHVVNSAFRYDYKTQTLFGPEAFAAYFNRFIRPHLRPGLAKGNAKLTKSLKLKDLGVRASGESRLKVRIERTFVRHRGRRFALIYFEIPAFRYRTLRGEPVLHWARGMSVSAADFGITYYAGIRHRGVANPVGAAQRPLSAKIYSYATDEKGRPLLPLAKFGAARALMRRANEGFADAAPVRLKKPANRDLPAIMSRDFAKVSLSLTPFAFSIAENSVNDTGLSIHQTSDNSSAKTTIVNKFAQTVLSARPDLKYLFNSEEYLFKVTEAGKRHAAKLGANLEHFRNNGGPALEKAQKSAFQAFKNVPGKARYSQIMQEVVRLRNAGDAGGANKLLDNSADFLRRFNVDFEAAYGKLDDLSVKLTKIQNTMPFDSEDLRRSSNSVISSLNRRDADLARKGNKAKIAAAGFLKTLGFLGTGANGVETVDKLLKSIDPRYGAQDFVGSSARRPPRTRQELQQYRNDAAQHYADSAGSRLFWQLLDVGLSAGLGDPVNFGISSVKIVAESAGNTRAAYSGMVDSRYDINAAAADARYLAHLKQHKEWKAAYDVLDSGKADLASLKKAMNAESEIWGWLAAARDPTSTGAPEKPEPTREELIRGLANELNGLDSGYPTVSEEQKRRIRERARAAIGKSEKLAGIGALLGGAIPDFGEAGRMPSDIGDQNINDLLSSMGIDPTVPWGSARETRNVFLSELFDGAFGSGLGAAVGALALSLVDDKPHSVTLPEVEFQKYVDDNAFKYNNMHAIVPTDLSAYKEWLATQDVRRLEIIARNAGYPNLASALKDWKSLIKKASDQGFRDWANSPPVPSAFVNANIAWQQRGLVRAQLLLGDILNDSRFIQSLGGLTDVTISGGQLNLTLIDFGIEDGDVITLLVTQYGRTLLNRSFTLRNPPGEDVSAAIRAGVAAVVVTAVNEGFASPNTAQVNIGNVVMGNAVQVYSLRTGEQAVLRIQSGN